MERQHLLPDEALTFALYPPEIHDNEQTFADYHEYSALGLMEPQECSDTGSLWIDYDSSLRMFALFWTRNQLLDRSPGWMRKSLYGKRFRSLVIWSSFRKYVTKIKMGPLEELSNEDEEAKDWENDASIWYG